MRLRPAPAWALIGSLSEAGGGLLVALGLFTPLGTAALVAAMLMALTVHWPRFFVQDGGIEYALLNLLGALGIAVAGPGVYSLDTVLGLALPEPLTVIVALVLAVVGVGVALATRAPAPAPVAARE